MIIGFEEVRTRQVKGDWFKYTYFNNGVKNFVFCQNKETFIHLIAKWNSQGQGRYQYTFHTVHGEPISLEDIVRHQCFKIKVLLSVDGREYIQ